MVDGDGGLPRCARGRRCVVQSRADVGEHGAEGSCDRKEILDPCWAVVVAHPCGGTAPPAELIQDVRGRAEVLRLRVGAYSEAMRTNSETFRDRTDVVTDELVRQLGGDPREEGAGSATGTEVRHDD